MAKATLSGACTRERVPRAVEPVRRGAATGASAAFDDADDTDRLLPPCVTIVVEMLQLLHPPIVFPL